MERVGTALIGLGKVAETHAAALSSLPGSHFVAVCDAFAERSETFGRKYGVKAYTRLDDLLEDPQVQAVIVCTPHPTHAAIAIRAAESGRHVLVEKPMAVRLSDCDAMIEAASTHRVKLGVVSQRRLYEPVARVRAAITEGRIGEPALGTLMVLGWRSPDYYQLDPWRGTWSGEGGGVLVTQVTHHLDLFQWLMGPVSELYGYWANLNHPSIEVEDTAVAVLRFANGALGSIVASNSQKPGLFGKIHVHGTSGASVGVQVESGSAFISGVTSEAAPPINDIWTIPGEEHLLQQWQREDTARAGAIDIMQEYHRRQIEDFLAAITEDREPMVTGRDGRKSVELFTAIYESGRRGGVVRFPLGTEPIEPPATGPRSMEQ
jgi:UDP-N-acetyl-2-amino-2-deoxyglucuronate dehydrogenase